MINNIPKVSVIIPAFNEEENICQTINDLQQSDFLEIIVVDNGSTDNTATLAKQQDVKVVDFPEGSIAAVRNKGVKESTGEILIFIDSDVRVTSKWHQNILSTIKKLYLKPLMVTGSRVLPPNSDLWLNKYWFSELTSYRAPYINSGHLITSKKLFIQVNGFTEELETAEDYDFCQKAKKVGAIIHDNSDLVVIHEGYPKILLGLIQRERWHGRQDVETWTSFYNSKIAWFAAINLILILLSAAAFLIGFYIVGAAYLLLMYIVCFMLTTYKFGLKKLIYMVIMPVIFYFYLCGRTLSIIDRLFRAKRR